MSEPSPRQPSPHDSDYDGAWKDALRGHFRELLEKYCPAAAETIDWQHPPQWSDNAEKADTQQFPWSVVDISASRSNGNC
ncbi:MAG TPA: hypothetical protein VMM76_04895 [Pirellulaceae bacterium]|nr:hypothetical protein [Pirellulaceae bacterium]